MTQAAFDFTPRATQAAHLERVSGRIADLILDFCRARVGQEFHADELRAWVAAHEVAAPGSADRVLRALRQAGRVAYVVVSRSESRYRVQSVGAEGLP